MAAPENFRYHTPIVVRYADMDTLGHVNNAKYLTYLEQARIGYFNDLNLWDGQPSDQGLIVAKITIEYKAPLAMRDGLVDVWTRCSRLGGKSFDMTHEIRRASDDALAATSVIVVVAMNYRTNETIALPDAWRKALTDYEPALPGE